jgi:flagellar hook-associated protein 3 FlgL
MRITFDQAFRDGLRDITVTGEQLADAQRRVSSGRRLAAPSDDPSAMAAAIGEHSRMATIDAYRRATDTAASRLSLTDTVLTDMIDQLEAAKVAVTAARGSGKTQAQLDAFSNELLSIRDALASDINTRFGSTYLFGGASSTTPPYVEAPAGVWTYTGDSPPVSLDIADGRSIQITFNGDEVLQGTEPVHVLEMLTTLAAAVRAGDAAAMVQGFDDVGRALDRAVFAQTKVGNAQRTIDDVLPQLDAARLAAQTRISKLEDADMAVAISDLARAETAHQSALAAFATIGRMTLMDYLK